METASFFEDILRLLSLRDANTRVVLFGTIVLGIASGIIGVFALLRKRALVGDALSHAALPGLCIAFLIVGQKSFYFLLLGALCSGVIGILLISVISKYTRVSEEAAIGIILSTFFGLGICLSRIIQNNPQSQQSGLDTFIYGKAASMLTVDAWLIAASCLLIILITTLFFKEFSIICFDPDYAKASGWPVQLIDFLLMACVVITTVVGLQAVGVVLIIALLITPGAAARFWTENLNHLVILAAIFGGISAFFGAAYSAVNPQLPTGPTIVLFAAGFFVLSLLFAPHRGLLAKYLVLTSLRRKVARQHLLRAIFERLEARKSHKTDFQNLSEMLSESFSFEEIFRHRSWKSSALKQEIQKARRRGIITQSGNLYQLSEQGKELAIEIVRNHRLWELYLIAYADIAPSHVDTSADSIEHILPKEIIERLEVDLLKKHPTLNLPIPKSPHLISTQAKLAQANLETAVDDKSLGDKII